MSAKTPKKTKPETVNRSTSPNAIWGGRFDASPATVMEQINASIDFDKRLYAQDIAGSKAHCEMLVAQGIIDQADGKAIVEGLDRVLSEIETGAFEFKTVLEDIHLNIEARLREHIGEAAGRLHTARSRNDQVATDFKLWVRDAIDGLGTGVRDLQAALIDQAENHAATIMPGFTHLQAAQPVTVGHHLLAYVEMFGRDRGRLGDARVRLNESPLGAAALAGTSFPIDREATAATLGFDRPMANAMDAVSDRDFALEFLAAGAILAGHLSRFGEEIVIWCSTQFGFASLGDGFTTGSSIMPQKRNPDAAELIRAKSGRVLGALTGLSVVMKGLPLAYAKDMQEDKEQVFDAADALVLSVSAATGMVRDLRFDPERLLDAARARFITATDLADWLVQTLNMPFRDAHHTTGRLVKLAEEQNCDLADLSIADMRAVEPNINESVYSALRLEDTVASRTSLGGTAPERVLEAVRAAREKFL